MLRVWSTLWRWNALQTHDEKESTFDRMQTDETTNLSAVLTAERCIFDNDRMRFIVFNLSVSVASTGTMFVLLLITISLVHAQQSIIEITQYRALLALYASLGVSAQ